MSPLEATLPGLAGSWFAVLTVPARERARYFDGRRPEG
jgi:hypothetical protein